VRWGLADHLRERDPAVEVEGRFSTEADLDIDALTGRATGRPLVVVVRDLHRHPWQERALSGMLRLHPDVTVVEMGLPARRPPGARAYLRTFGAARVNAQAAAELLR
jgi:beta-N-acetylhexosaminidase